MEDDPPLPEIAAANWPSDRFVVETMFRAYAGSLDVDLRLQGFDEELVLLPGKYGRDRRGVVGLARLKGEAVGVGCYRRLDDARCEMKRVYVLPDGRGRGLGRRIVEWLIADAAACGYDEMVLDTLPEMGAAQRLYRQLGFREIAPYYSAPFAGTVYLGRAIGGADGVAV